MNRLALALAGLVVALVLAGTVMSAGRDVLTELVLYATLPLALAAVGALVVTRADGNRIGWAFLGLALFISLHEAVEGYGLLADDTALSDGQVGAWTGTWAWAVELAAWTIITALFPSGRLAGPGWRWVPWTAGVGALAVVIGMAFGTWSDPEFASGHNPFLVDHPLVEVAFPVGMTLLAVALAGAAASLVQRMRGARGMERQQLKWFGFAACVVALVAPVAVALWNVVPGMPALTALLVNMLPVATGIAILRYRLYDIDLVVKRTLVYTALTVVLVATYAGLVLLLQALLHPVSGDSDLAVAASTLAVAALFRPLRSALQRSVDRRFSRSRYDAARTLDGFSGRLGHELDLDAVSADLRTVVHDTLQPAHVSLWLREAEHERPLSVSGNDSRTPGP